MKYSGIILSLLVLPILIFSSCEEDPPEIPMGIVGDLDTTIFDGDFDDYTPPVFPENTNTERNVLIEYFSGMKCAFCYRSDSAGLQLTSTYPDRVFYTSIHGGPTPSGSSAFQSVDDDYTYDFTNPYGLEMAATYFNDEVSGFFAIPRGFINRKGDPMMTSPENWGEDVIPALSEELEINLQAHSDYYASSDGLYFHVETDFENDLSGDYNLVVYVVKNKITAPNLVLNEYVEDYVFTNTHIDNLSENTWGVNISTGDVVGGTKIETAYSYFLPEGLSPSDIHFQVFIYNVETLEVMQTIRHDI